MPPTLSRAERAHTPWTIEREDSILVGAREHVRRREVRTVDGDAFVISHTSVQPSVHVLAVTAAQEIVLVRQWRAGPGGGMVTTELVAGMVDPGEEPIEAAARELAEEAQMRAGQLQPLGAWPRVPATSDAVVRLFLARDVVPIEDATEVGESVEVVCLPLDLALAQMHQPAYGYDIVAVSGILLARAMGAVRERPRRG